MYQESLKSSSTPITTIVESSNPNTRLASSLSSKWVIDIGAIDHMIGNFSLLTGPKYLDWSKTIWMYLRSIRMNSHLTKDPPTDDSKEQCMEEDARHFLQICNSIDVKDLISLIAMSLLRS